MTCVGFCVVAALSRYTRGFPPETLRSRMGKSLRTAFASSMVTPGPPTPSTLQPPDEGAAKLLADLLHGHLLQQGAEEALHDEALGRQLVEAARLEVEELLGVTWPTVAPWLAETSLFSTSSLGMASARAPSLRMSVSWCWWPDALRA